MSRVSSRSARAFRLTAVMLAVAGACAFQPAWAQTTAPVLPTGGVAVHGTAGIATAGSTMTVTTTNGVGTNRSVINWQGFSIGAGARVDFLQPSVDSTSINRVVTGTPSSLLGTLTSNGRLVLVNPAGIAVGAGAVVDTAAFTASTLGLAEADAVKGRLLFTRDPNATGLLQVDGKITTRSGDLVLVGPRISTGASAVLQASGGSAILAAGESVEITGPGLEGIVMKVQAGDEAVNLGSMTGDAVGIFAASLTHSGVIQANAVSTADGKVMLKALAGDATVSGSVRAQATAARDGGIEVSGNSIRGTGSYTSEGGPVTLTAGSGAIDFGFIDADGVAAGVDGGTVIVKAQGDVNGFGIVANGADAAAGGARGGAVSVVSAAGNIQLAGATANGGSSDAGDGGAAGSIRLTALGTGAAAGTITLGDRAGVSPALLVAHGGDGADTFTETGFVAGKGGDGGSVVVKAAGSVRIGTVFSSASPTLAGSVTGPTAFIDASGGSAQSGPAGAGGALDFRAGTGDITMLGTSLAMAVGGNAVLAGDGGTIRFDAGGQLALGQVLATGGFGTQPGPDTAGGAGGTLTLSAGGNVAAELLDAGGGGIVLPRLTTQTTALASTALATSGGGTGGAGGAIKVSAGGNVTLGGVIASGAGAGSVTGSSGVFDVGGAGGKVDITAGGNVTVATQSEGLLLFGILADGGSGALQGGDAGHIDVKAGGTLTVQVPDPANVDALGGVRAVGGDGASAGKGGAVTLRADAFSLPFVEAFGGTGGADAGGAGGSIRLTRPTGDFVFDGGVRLDARGGDGNTGGAGGSVVLAADAGAVRLRSPLVFAAGGQGAAGNGAAGKFSAEGTSVEVEGNFILDAAWENGSVVNVTGASIVSLAGPFENLAGAMLAGTGTVRIAGGTGLLDNSGTIAPGGDGTIGTLTIEGDLRMQPHSTLAVDLASATSFDQLKVSGAATVDGSSGVLVKYAPSAALAPGDSLAVLQAGSVAAAPPPPVSEAAGTTRPAAIAGLAAAAGPGSLLLTALASSAPPPPAPEGQLEQSEVREVFNLTADFVDHFDRLVEQGQPLRHPERKAGKDDIVLTGNACRP